MTNLRDHLAAALKKLGLWSFMVIFTVYTIGCNQPPERVYETREEIVAACATADSEAVVLPDGTLRTFFAVPQADDSAFIQITDTAPDGTESVGGLFVDPADAPAVTQTLLLDGTTLLEFDNGMPAVTVETQQESVTGELKYSLRDAATGAALVTVNADGFNPSTAAGSAGGDDGMAPGPTPQGWFAILAIVVVIVVVVVVAANVYCQTVVLPNLMTVCGNLCATMGMGFNFTGVCSIAGSVTTGPQTGGGGAVGTSMAGCNCVPTTGGGNPVLLPAVPAAQLPNGADPNLGVNEANDCLPKVPAPPGAQENR